MLGLGGLHTERQRPKNVRGLLRNNVVAKEPPGLSAAVANADHRVQWGISVLMQPARCVTIFGGKGALAQTFL